MIKQLTLSLSLALFLSLSLHAQESATVPVENLKVEVTYAKFLGKTPQLRHLVPQASTTQERREMSEDRKRVPQNFGGYRTGSPQNPNALPKGEDPVRQSELNKNMGLTVEPLVNMDGISRETTPHDPTGDVGLDYYIQAVNSTTFRIYNKDGSPASDEIAANTIWNTIGFMSAGDPIIFFDQEAERWVLTEFPFGGQLLVAVTETSDPFGSWLAYNFSTPNFPDYPKYSVWNNAYCVTTNEQGPSILPAYFIDRVALLNGDEDVMVQRIELPGIETVTGVYVASPVDWTGDTAPPEGANPMILRMNNDEWGDTDTDQIDIFTIDLDWEDPANTTSTMTSVISAPFDPMPCSSDIFGGGCVPQADGNDIDGIPQVLMHQIHYRNFGSHEAMVMTFIVDVTAGENLSGIRWMEMRRTSGEDWFMHQEGTFAPDDGLSRYVPSIAIDASGNIAVAYGVSSPDLNVGLRFTGRRESDPLGEMTVDEYTLVEGSSVNFSVRYGDYAHMTVDPVDQKTFWFTGEYLGDLGAATRIASFQIGKDTSDFAPSALLTPQSADDLTATETVKIAIKNVGLDTQSVFTIGYIFENEPAVFLEIDSTIVPDSVYVHTFIPTVDMSAIGNYDFKIFTGLAEDDAIFNDTLRVVRSKFPRFDAGVTGFNGLDNSLCFVDGEEEASLELTNLGTDTLTTVTIIIEINGMPTDTIEWTGSLTFGETEDVSFILSNLINGENTITAATSLPNGMVDETMENDAFTRTFDVILNGVDVIVSILTDEYPGETTWEITNDDGDILYNGGPYNQQETLIEETVCLDEEVCYTFSISDAFGDGICCGYGLGAYHLEDGEGNILLESPTGGAFGFEEVSDFCPIYTCLITADIDISLVSAAGESDGTILISAANVGAGGLLYSIDGGNTFIPANIFNNLPSGNYDIVVSNGGTCIYEETVTIMTCTLEATVEVTNESQTNASDGELTIDVLNGLAPFEYSLNGITFQDTPVFSELSTNDYDVFVRDANGCIIKIDVIVDVDVSAGNVIFGQGIEVFPNPTNGVFKVNVKGLNRQDVFLPFQIVDITGKLVRVGKLARYDDTYTSEISLTSKPSGVYFIRFLDNQVDRMVKVIKE